MMFGVRPYLVLHERALTRPIGKDPNHIQAYAVAEAIDEGGRIAPQIDAVNGSIMCPVSLRPSQADANDLMVGL